jgi:hypothetical protein
VDLGAGIAGAERSVEQLVVTLDALPRLSTVLEIGQALG